MPRGKNYVNQNTGMKLQGGKEKVMELCFYGNACTRKDCIYRHDRTSKLIVGNLPKSYTDPCMAYLAGYCAFTDTTCRKYHPTTDEEVNTLIQKYNSIPCKFTIHCKTKGCLYKHIDPNSTGMMTMMTKMPMMMMMTTTTMDPNPRNWNHPTSTTSKRTLPLNNNNQHHFQHHNHINNDDDFPPLLTSTGITTTNSREHYQNTVLSNPDRKSHV